MCGIIGIINHKSIASTSCEVYRGLLTLQHRGQDAAGILSFDANKKRFYQHKDLGLVSSVFDSGQLEKLKGNMAIGHTRYATAGTDEREDLQPLVSGQALGVGMVHNGNLLNYRQLEEKLRVNYGQQLLTSNDLEIILNYWSYQTGQGPFSFERAQKAVAKIFEKVIGGYAVVGMVATHGLFAFRDPNGLRPLVLGKKDGAYCICSEDMTLNFLEYQFVRDIAPGELIFINMQGEIQSVIVGRARSASCMFEWVYFSGAESTVEGRSVYGARLALGEYLGQRVQKFIAEGKICPDIVVPIPDTSRPTAIALAEYLKLPYREALIKNRYIYRSFILESHEKREKAVQLKLSPVRSEIEGKNILLIDDSVVRGTTSRRIIALLKKYGAKNITMASACPMIKHPCYYGIDFPVSSELIAHQRSEEAIADMLGLDAMIYLNLDDLPRAIGCSGLCMACLNGDYPTSLEGVGQYSQERRP